MIVTPEEAIQRWMIKGATSAENFTSDSVKTYLNWQGTAEKGLDCAMYHFTLGNRKQIFIRGDIYHREGFLGCMDFIEKNSLGIDYAFATHYFTSGEAPIPSGCAFPVPLYSDTRMGIQPSSGRYSGRCHSMLCRTPVGLRRTLCGGQGTVPDLGRKYRAGLKQVFISCNQILSPPGSPMKSFAKHIPFPA